MKKLSSLVCVLLLAPVFPALAQGPAFVETAGEMVDQMLGAEKPGQTFGKTRSFVIVEGQEQTSRAISMRRRNVQGKAETVVVQVPSKGLDPAARLKVEFDVNSASLRPTAYKLLGELAKALQDEKVVEHRVCVKGHTDADGSDAYNLQLSYERADSVRAYLLGAHGLPPARLQVFGFGEAMPLTDNLTAENRQLNRRVEVSLDCPELRP